MNIQALGGVIKATAIRTGYVIKDNAPQILAYTAAASSVLAVGLAVRASVKKLPKIKSEFDDAIDKIQLEISDPTDSAIQTLEEIGEETIALIFSAEYDNNSDALEKRKQITNLKIIWEDGRQLEAAEVTKAKLKRVGKIVLAFTPATLCLAGSIICNLAGLHISLRRLANAGAIITGLTAELATARKERKELLGPAEANAQDFKALTPAKTEEGEDDIDALRQMLYVKVYDNHLLAGSDVEDCVRMAESQLRNFEALQNRKLERSHLHYDDHIGRVYYGDVLRALGFNTDECGQNTGWISRDYPSEYDGYIDFGCWVVDPVHGTKTINPECVDEDGRILLNFNVEGYIPDLLKEAKSKSSFRSM